MSVARWLAKSIGGFLFVTLLGLAIASLALANLTDYANLRGPMIDMFAAAMTAQEPANATNQSSEILDDLKADCARSSSPTISRPVGNTSVSLSCADINAATPSNMYNIFAGSFVDEMHYKNYSCSYISCLRSDMPMEEKIVMAMFSGQAHSFYASIIIYLLIGAVIGGVLMAWGAGSVPAALRAFGWSLVAIGMGYFFIGPVGSIVPTPAGSEAAVSSLLSPMFAVLSQYYLYCLVVGVVLLVLGYTIGFLRKREKKAE